MIDKSGNIYFKHKPPPKPPPNTPINIPLKNNEKYSILHIFEFFFIHIIYIRFPYIKPGKNIIFEHISPVSLCLLFVKIAPNLETTRLAGVKVPWAARYSWQACSSMDTLLFLPTSPPLERISINLKSHSVLEVADICSENYVHVILTSFYDGS